MRGFVRVAPPDRVRVVHDGVTGMDVIWARFATHAYDLHRQDEWLIGATDSGVQDFKCRGARRRSTSGRVILIGLGEAHDGEGGAVGDFAYRMLYLPRSWLRAELGDASGGDPGFAANLCDVAFLVRSIRRVCVASSRPTQPQARDLALDDVLHRLRPHLGHPVRGTPARRDVSVARRARERLHDDMATDPGADGLAQAAGAADRFQLAQAFRAAYGYGPKPGAAIKPTVLTLDNGPIHVSKATRAALAERAHWLTIEWLLKYASELNDIEEVWRDLKRHHLAHQTFTGADDLDHAIHNAVAKLNKERTRHPLDSQRIAA
jgi:transposase